MPRIQQGSVMWATLPQPVGRRPVVVLTRNAAIGKLNSVTIAAVTRTIRKLQTEVILEPEDGVPTVCAVNLDNIFTVPRAALDQRITVLDRKKMLAVFHAIKRAFDMP